MRRSMLWVPVLGLSLACWGGCRRDEQAGEPGTAGKRVERDDVLRPTDEDDVEGDGGGQTTGKAGERQPVAGHDERTVLNDLLRDKLGDDWLIDRRGDRLVCNRLKASPVASDFQKRLKEEMRELRESHKGLTASYGRNMVSLVGRSADCADVANAVSDLTAVNGVDRIVVDVRCQ